MLIREWMTKDVITVTPDTSMLKASKLMKDHNIRRLPVLDGKHVVGIVSDRDIRAASPSKATTLDMHELYYLLSEVKVKDIMTSDPVTVYDTDAVDAAALLSCALPLLYVGVFSCGVGYTLQILAQKDSNPTVVTILLSLESVFAVIAGAIILHQHMTPREYLGCALMFLAVVLAQIPLPAKAARAEK